MKKLTVLLMCVCCVFTAQAQKQFTLNSPGGNLQTTITIGDQLTYDITCDGRQILAPSPIAMSLDNGEVWGEKAKLSGTSRKSVDRMVSSPFYRANELRDHYNELTLRFKKDWNVEFRAYDDGIVYRFVSRAKKPFNVLDEIVDYQFPFDAVASVPYVNRGKDGDYESQFFNSFENTYVTNNLSKQNKKRLMFLPLVVEAGDGVKICITESDLENYPGLFLSAAKGENRLSGKFAPYPKRTVQGGHNKLQMLVAEREDYIAKVDKPRSFPWRMAIVTTSDKDLASSNLSYLLAAPSRLSDLSWIKPGKVAWDWWNAWNLDSVDFATGVNNATYKAYIDFASSKGIEYVILDEGWAVNLKADLMQVVKDIDLKELVDYAADRNVGIILWAGYYAFERDMENVCRHYAAMGVKGFKVDFMDRDDQEMTAFNYRAAETCAKYKMILDLHGTHKPAGLNRTYPNVLNFEGVNGLEQMKWSSPSVDQVKYDVMIPFIRQVSGPMDYTPGVFDLDYSRVRGRETGMQEWNGDNNSCCIKTTLARQIANWVIIYSPLQMASDLIENYEGHPAFQFFRDFDADCDWSEALQGEPGEYIVVVRRADDSFFLGAGTNDEPRTLTQKLGFLKSGMTYTATIYADAPDSAENPENYRIEKRTVTSADMLEIAMTARGGQAVTFVPVNE